MKNGIQAYRALDVATKVDGADQHSLVKMLFDGALARLQKAKGCLARGDIEGRNVALGQVVSIVNGLQGSLDHEAGGELAGNLEALYDYIVRRLHRANVDRDIAAIEEVVSLIAMLRDAWDAIGETALAANA